MPINKITGGYSEFEGEIESAKGFSNAHLNITKSCKFEILSSVTKTSLWRKLSENGQHGPKFS